MKKNQAAVISILSAAVFTLAFLVSSRLWFRIDLTRNKVYTISKVSENLYREITDQVRITYFVSDKLKAAYPLPGEIADVLREYAARSRGRIRFIEKDPAKGDLLNKVEDLGLEPRQIRVNDKNETTLAVVYSGILIEYMDRKAVIPLVFSPETLEYDLSSRIRSLVRNTEKELGVIVADSYREWNSAYSLLDRQLVLSGFKIRPVSPGEEIPASLKALFVLGGAEDLDEHALGLIDRFIQGGGNVLFAVDGVFVDTSAGFEARAVKDKGLLAMLANYGVVVRRALVLDRSALNLTFQTRTGNGTVIRTVKYPEWIAVQETGANKDSPLTARFGGLDLYWASPLELSPPPGVSAEVLFTSTAGAWLQTENFITNPAMISRFEEEAQTRGIKILGASLAGVFPGFVPGFVGEASPDRKSARLIVVGDSDFAGRLMMATQAEARNLDFLLRAAEWLSGDDDIITIRSRNDTAGRLDRITDSGKRNAVMTFSRTVNTIVIPVGVIIAGLIIGLKRKAGTGKEKGQANGV